MSCRSHLVRVIRSMGNFQAVTFFPDPNGSVGCWRFSCVDVVRGLEPPSSVFASSSSCPYKGVACPSPTLMAIAYVVDVAVAFSYLNFFASHATHTSATTISFFNFSSSCVMCILKSSFFFYTIDFSISIMFRACHSGSHACRTLKMASSVATKGIFLHCLVGSLCTLIYMLCMYAFNSAKLCTLL